MENVKSNKALKNIAIADHLIALEEAIQKYETLVERIDGSGSAEVEKDTGYDFHSMSLASLLDIIPEVLGGFSSVIHKTTNALEEALY